jgi:hypothetical protein
MQRLGLILLIAGLLGLAVGTFQYTHRKEVLKVGDIRVEKNEKETVSIPPLLAGGVAAVGLVLVLTGRKK